MDQSATVSTLNRLIETCKDGEMGFRACAEHVRSLEFKTLLASMADGCIEARGELSVLVRHLGGEPHRHGSVTGALHRGWVDLTAALLRADDQAILDECQRGEDSAQQHYREALACNVAPDIRIAIDRQYQKLLKNRARLKALRENAS